MVQRKKVKNAKQYLTAKRVQRLLRTPGRYRDADVRGLLLVVVESKAERDDDRPRRTTASWQLRYERIGKERWLGLGSASEVTLAEARDGALAARAQLRNGIDPVDAKKAKRAADALAAARMITFEDAARQYHTQHRGGWKNPKHAAQFISTLEEYAFPRIGRLAVADIDTGQVLRVLEQDYIKDGKAVRLWDAIPETAKRLRGRIERILDWAAVRNFRSGDNPARWSGHLSEALPGRRKNGRHHPALDYAAIPAFMTDLRQRNGVGARAVEFLVLTAARTGAVIGAKWSEIDLANKVWTVPPDRAGTKIAGEDAKPRRVPLTDPVIDLLRKLARERGNPYVFVGGKEGKGLSNMALLEVTKEMAVPSTTPGKIATPHGMRSTFRDWVAECTSYEAWLAEAALWHVVADKVEAAYRRGDAIEKRRRLMAQWAKYCASKPAKATGNVVSLRSR